MIRGLRIFWGDNEWVGTSIRVCDVFTIFGELVYIGISNARGAGGTPPITEVS